MEQEKERVEGPGGSQLERSLATKDDRARMEQDGNGASTEEAEEHSGGASAAGAESRASEAPAAETVGGTSGTTAAGADGRSGRASAAGAESRASEASAAETVGGTSGTSAAEADGRSGRVSAAGAESRASEAPAAEAEEHSGGASAAENAGRTSGTSAAGAEASGGLAAEQPAAEEPGWRFDTTYTRLPGVFYTKQQPEPAKAPGLAVLNERLAEALGLSPEVLRRPGSVEVFAGSRVPVGAEPLAQAYAGHQFGHFTMLGDGRALLIGEHVTPTGERVDIQLKGSGRTPYSRRGDGRAALGPMLREYIISEAMAGLGIPTTRSLAVATTGEVVIREQDLPGAVLTRVAASHIRVGTFQYAALRGTDALQALADYTLERHYPEIDRAVEPNPYVALLRGAIGRQARLIAQWMLVGFVHGVMNTDNMTLSGETIDYGPCAFLDAYARDTVFSSIDHQGRYAYGNQPQIGAWNLARLAEALLPLLHEDEGEAIKLAEQELQSYGEHYHSAWLSGMRGKLGLFGEEPEDAELVQDLLTMMEKHKADYTNTFRALTLGRPEDLPMYGGTEFTQWQERRAARLARQNQSAEEATALMRRSNPAVIPRNHRVEEALAAATFDDDMAPLERLVAVLADPYAYSCDQEAYAAPTQSPYPFVTFCGT